MEVKDDKTEDDGKEKQERAEGRREGGNSKQKGEEKMYKLPYLQCPPSCPC